MYRSRQPNSSIPPLLVAALACVWLPACGPTGPIDPPRPRKPHLIQDSGQWYIKDLHPEAAGMAERGRLFAALRPIAGTDDHEPVAVLRSLRPAPKGGTTIPIAVQCLAFEQELAVGMAAEYLESSTSQNVGRCLAQVVEESKPDNRESYVILNVGTGQHVQPGDQYLLLGKPVTQPGQVPSGLDTTLDGRCQIPLDTTLIKQVTTHCMLTKRPPRQGSLIGVYAAFDTPETP